MLKNYIMLIKIVKPVIVITVFISILFALFLLFSMVKGPSNSNTELNKGSIGLLQNNINRIVSSEPLSKYSVITNWNLNAKNPMSTSKGINNTIQFEINPNFFVKDEIINSVFLKSVLAHESIHAITLQNNQFENLLKKEENTRESFLLNENNCKPNYFNSDGCFESDSLINCYYIKFWNGNMKYEFDQIQNKTNLTSDEFQKNLAQWGQKYKSQFLTKRSIESPEEDLAEIFSYAVTNVKMGLNPSTSITPEIAEKIKFVESQPELIQFKKEFNESFNEYFPENNSSPAS